MKLRFDVDQAACFRAGIDHSTSTSTIDVDPGRIEPSLRNLIADRLFGIDVCCLWNSEKGTQKMLDDQGKPVRILAEGPSFEALVKAIQGDQKVVEERQSQHRSIALAMAQSGVDIAQVMQFALTDPKPDEGYKRMQKRRHELQSLSNKSIAELDDNNRVETALEKAFKKAFGLSADKGHSAALFVRKHREGFLKTESQMFDHVSYFQKGPNFFIVTQPYHLDQREFRELVTRLGVKGFIAPEWAFYFPGRASLAILEFTPEIRERMNKTI